MCGLQPESSNFSCIQYLSSYLSISNTKPQFIGRLEVEVESYVDLELLRVLISKDMRPPCILVEVYNLCTGVLHFILFELFEVAGVTVLFQVLDPGGYGTYGTGFSEVFEALRKESTSSLLELLCYQGSTVYAGCAQL